jgi:hypothetical protein
MKMAEVFTTDSRNNMIEVVLREKQARLSGVDEWWRSGRTGQSEPA